jgi:hypothetical protein
MLELTFLLISITVLLLFVYFKNKRITQNEFKEPFDNFYLSACPSGYKSFYNNNGDNICCDGEIIGNKCLSDNKCILNGSGIPNTPNCIELIKLQYFDKAKEYCMPSLPNYFEDKVNKIKGCMIGPLNETMTGPQQNYQSKCFIYDTFEKDTNAIDSCSNQKQLDSAKCFGNNCSKRLAQPNKSTPPLVVIQFTDNTGMPRMAYTRASYENFLNVSNPSWRNQGLDLSKNIIVAEVAKAFYIDKTIQQKDIQI